MDYRSNKAWQRCDDLAVAVYRATVSFPREERYGLTKQMRDAAVSAAANVAEGYGRRTVRDLAALQGEAARALQGLIRYWEQESGSGRVEIDRRSPRSPAPPP